MIILKTVLFFSKQNISQLQDGVGLVFGLGRVLYLSKWGYFYHFYLFGNKSNCGHFSQNENQSREAKHFPRAIVSYSNLGIWERASFLVYTLGFWTLISPLRHKRYIETCTYLLISEGSIIKVVFCILLRLLSLMQQYRKYSYV